MHNIVKTPPPRSEEFLERIEDLFSKISCGLLHRETLIGMAGELCLQGDTPDELGAILYALNGLNDQLPTLVLANLRDTVNLLVERVRELEAP